MILRKYIVQTTTDETYEHAGGTYLVHAINKRNAKLQVEAICKESLSQKVTDITIVRDRKIPKVICVQEPSFE